MRVLDLFSGIGGFSLGLERAGMETVAFCEYDKKAQLVLKKHWPDVPIFDDVRGLTYEQLKKDGIVGNAKLYGLSTIGDFWGIQGEPPRENGDLKQPERSGHPSRGATDIEAPPINLICGGFPCQPFSTAGKQRGKEDVRHLWPEYFRLIQEIRPNWVIGENVAGLINMGLDQVLSDLESEGYTVQTFNIPACAVNAPHRRDRVWIVANSISPRGSGGEHNKTDGYGGNHRGAGTKIQRKGKDSKITKADPNPNSKRLQGGKKNRDNEQRGTQPNNKLIGRLCTGNRANQWKTEPRVGRVANGIPKRMDRLKQLGNAVVRKLLR